MLSEQLRKGLASSSMLPGGRGVVAVALFFLLLHSTACSHFLINEPRRLDKGDGEPIMTICAERSVLPVLDGVGVAFWGAVSGFVIVEVVQTIEVAHAMVYPIYGLISLTALHGYSAYEGLEKVRKCRELKEQDREDRAKVRADVLELQGAAKRVSGVIEIISTAPPAEPFPPGLEPERVIPDDPICNDRRLDQQPLPSGCRCLEASGCASHLCQRVDEVTAPEGRCTSRCPLGCPDDQVCLIKAEDNSAVCGPHP